MHPNRVQRSTGTHDRPLWCNYLSSSLSPSRSTLEYNKNGQRRITKNCRNPCHAQLKKKLNFDWKCLRNAFAYISCFVIASLETAIPNCGAFRFLVESDNRTNRLPMASRINKCQDFKSHVPRFVVSSTRSGLSSVSIKDRFL